MWKAAPSTYFEAAASLQMAVGQSGLSRLWSQTTIFVAIFYFQNMGPRLFLMKSRYFQATKYMLGLLPGCKGSFWGVIAQMLIPWLYIALMYFTKYFAQESQYYNFRVPPMDFPLSFIQVGGLQGVAIVLILGLMARMLLRTGTKFTQSGARLNLLWSMSVWPAGKSLQLKTWSSRSDEPMLSLKKLIPICPSQLPKSSLKRAFLAVAFILLISIALPPVRVQPKPSTT